MSTIRDHFPALSRQTYLNTAGGAPIPSQARTAAERYYRESFEDGDVHWSEWLDRVESARAEVGGLVGAMPDDVAFLGNATSALNALARLDEPGAFAFASGEFPSCTLPWLRRGFEPRPWTVRHDGSFSFDDVAAVLTPETRVVVLSWVQFATGFRADLASIAALCQRRGVRLVVDGTQAVGAFPLDLRKEGIDALVFSGYKWMTAGYGVAGLVVPGGFSGPGSPLAGWRSQAEPYRLISDQLDPDPAGRSAEGGHPPFPNVFSLGASAALWRGQQTSRTAERILGLARHVHQRLDARGLKVLSTRDPEALSGIVMLETPDPAGLAAALKQRDILVSARGRGVRVSFHAYNTEAELDLFAESVADIQAGMSRT